MSPSADLFKTDVTLKIKNDLLVLIKDRGFQICKNLSDRQVNSFADKRRDS